MDVHGGVVRGAGSGHLSGGHPSDNCDGWLQTGTVQANHMARLHLDVGRGTLRQTCL